MEVLNYFIFSSMFSISFRNLREQTIILNLEKMLLLIWFVLFIFLYQYVENKNFRLLSV